LQWSKKTSSLGARFVLEVSGVHLWRGDRHVLKGVSLRLQPGEALQLLWPNGVGKTSLLRVVAGLLPAESGNIQWLGRSITDQVQAFTHDLAYLGHDLALKGDLTVSENLRYSLGLRRSWDPGLVQTTLNQLDITALADRLVRQLSAGQQRRVALARLVLWDARLWLLDEPAAKLDAAGQAQVVTVIEQHLTGGGAVLLSTHQPLPLLQGINRLWQSPQEAA
jgi:heme exporter protein A